MGADISSSSQHTDWIASARQQFERVQRIQDGVLASAESRTRLSHTRQSPTSYAFIRQVHRGGQGVVYEARHETTGRTVAVKVMHDAQSADGSSAADMLRFDREVSILAQLNHPNIIGVIDRGTIEGSNYLAMDFVDGRPVDRFARENDLSTRARLELFATICDAINAAHQRGVIHRDIKPGNILVDVTGQPHILDFGLAKLTIGDTSIADQTATITGQFVGSLHWVSPEQALGKLDEVDVRSDVYSLGVMLYQLLTDQFPYSVVGSMSEVLKRICYATPIRPTTLSREVDDDLETIVLKSLSKEPDRRYQSVGEFARDIRHYLNDEPIEAKRDSGLYVLRKTLRRYRVAASVLAGFMILSIGSAVAMTLLYGKAKKEATKSRQIADFSQQMISGIDPVTAGTMDNKLMRVMLDKAAGQLNATLGSQPEAEAEIQNTIGRAYMAIGEFPESQKYLERSLETRRRLLDVDAPETLASLNDLAFLHREADRLQESLPLAREAAERRHRILGDEHPDTLTSDSNLAEVLGELGQFDEAVPLSQRTYEIRKRVLGSEHPDTLTSLNNLAMIYQDQNKYDEAERLTKESLDIQIRVQGREHPHTMRTMSNLAVVYGDHGKLGEAIEIAEEAVELKQRVFGDDHPDTINAMSNLAELYRRNNKLDQAEKMFLRVIEARTKKEGRNHRGNALNLTSLAQIKAERGDLAGAEAHYREALQIYQATVPADDWMIPSTKFSLGICLAKQQQYQQAEPLLLEAQASMKTNPSVPPAWNDAIVKHLSLFYENWDKADPNTGKAEKADEWRARMPPPPTSATTSGPA